MCTGRLFLVGINEEAGGGAGLEEVSKIVTDRRTIARVVSGVSLTVARAPKVAFAFEGSKEHWYVFSNVSISLRDTDQLTLATSAAAVRSNSNVVLGRLRFCDSVFGPWSKF